MDGFEAVLFVGSIMLVILIFIGIGVGKIKENNTANKTDLEQFRKWERSLSYDERRRFNQSVHEEEIRKIHWNGVENIPLKVFREKYRKGMIKP